ncbi:MAG: MFS transporter [Acidobacteriota bacterium]|nr:MFS transporter [Acidobacteriota bacterium]
MADNPFKAMFDIRKEEFPFAGLMGLYFFLVITSFWILKPIKKSLFIDYYKAAGGFDLDLFGWGWHMSGSEAELLAKVLNMVVAALAAAAFAALSNRFVRQQLAVLFSSFFVVCHLLYLAVLDAPSGWEVWSFYLFGDFFNTVMVATFFAFLNDSVTPDAAKRIYGLTGFGGVAGGAVGALVVASFVKKVSNEQWMLVLAAVAVVIAAIALLAGKKLPASAAPGKASKEKGGEEGGAVPSVNPAFEGARLVFRSRYLLAVVAIVGLYEMVSTIMDFQFTSAVEHFVTGGTGQHFSTVYLVTNVLAMVVQLFFTSLVMTRFGVGVALLVLPVAALCGSAGFLLFPALLTGSFLNTADNSFNYSINQSAKESLYVPVSKDEKYKAKAFIDMFVQRFAKAVAVGLSLAITALFTDFGAIRWLSLLSVAILAVWIFAARYAGRRFDEMTRP